MEIPGGCGRDCACQFCVLAVGPSALDQSDDDKSDDARGSQGSGGDNCSGIDGDEIRRPGIGCTGSERPRSFGDWRSAPSNSFTRRNSGGRPEVSVVRCHDRTPDRYRPAKRRTRSAAGRALSGRKHGRARSHRSSETAVEGRRQTERYGSGLAFRTISARRWRSSQLRSSAAPTRGCRQTRFSAGGATVAQSGIAGLSVRNPNRPGKSEEDPRTPRVF